MAYYRMEYSISPLYEQALLQESIPKFKLFISPTKLTRYPTNKIGYIVLYCNKLIIFFTQIHKKQTQKIKHFLLLQHSTLKSTVKQLPHRGILESSQDEGLYIGDLLYQKDYCLFKNKIDT